MGKVRHNKLQEEYHKDKEHQTAILLVLPNERADTFKYDEVYLEELW